MKSKLTVFFISVLLSIILLSVGFGKWQKELTIVGNIKVVPDPVVLADMNAQLEKLQNKLEEQKLYEAQQRMILEQERINLEQQKLQEEQVILDEHALEQSTGERSSEVIEDEIKEIKQEVTIKSSKEIEKLSDKEDVSNLVPDNNYEIENKDKDGIEEIDNDNNEISNTESIVDDTNEKSEEFSNDIITQNNEPDKKDKEIEKTIDNSEELENE